MKKNIKEKNYCETSGRIITSVDKLRAGKNLAAGLATEPLTVDHLWYDQTGIQMVFFGVLCCTNKPCIRSAWWIRLFLLNMPPVWCGASCGSRNPIVVETLLEYTSEKNFGQEIMADYLSEKLCFYSVKLPLHYCKVVFHITVIQSVVFPRLFWYDGWKNLES